MRILNQPWVKVMCAVVGVAAYGSISSAADQRSYAGVGISVESDGIAACAARTVSGGDVVADVVTGSAMAYGQFRDKHIANSKTKDIVVGLDMGSLTPWLGWINQSFSGKVSYKNGSVTTYDSQLSQVSKLSWQQGVISGIEFPELDAASKAGGEVKLTISPQRATRSGTGGKVATAASAKQQRFSASNFRITIDGVDLTRVARIQPLSVRTKVATNSVGIGRELEKVAGVAEVSNLVLFADSHDSASLQSWYESFVVRGEASQEKEKSGRIELLAPDMKTVLLSIGLHGVGIVTLGSESETSVNKDSLPRLRAELYVEYITVDPPK